MKQTQDPPGAVVARLRGVVKRFGTVTALAGLDLELRRGELTAVFGPNGAGKTTAIKLLLGLARPTAGSVELFGHAPGDLEVRRRRGAMLQVGKVPETLTVGEHLELFASYYLHPLAVAEVLRRTGLERLAGRRFGELSGGERQRTLYALALVGDPELLFLDEPTVGMDVEARRAVWQEIRHTVDEGRSVVLTTHYLEEADALAERVVVLHQGRMLADGDPASIKRQAALRRVRCRTLLPKATLLALPGVRQLIEEGDHVELLVAEAEPLVRELLALDPQVADLEVRSAGLEEAFLALTAAPGSGFVVAA
ncbi:MAG TPA: ABC transporter ATP-binding protein [Thermoanaerobaculia bacterium]|nr:ABC transporter ATP-binding protein [Thermoanaerobaculia bacterium]